MGALQGRPLPYPSCEQLLRPSHAAMQVHERAHRLGLGHRTEDLKGGKKELLLWRVPSKKDYGVSQDFAGVLSRGQSLEDNLKRT